MKKIELLYFTVIKNCVNCSTLSSSCTFFHQLLEIDTWNMYGILFSVEQMIFFCRAVEIPKKVSSSQDLSSCISSSWPWLSSLSRIPFVWRLFTFSRDVLIKGIMAPLGWTTFPKLGLLLVKVKSGFIDRKSQVVPLVKYQLFRL